MNIYILCLLLLRSKQEPELEFCNSEDAPNKTLKQIEVNTFGDNHNFYRCWFINYTKAMYKNTLSNLKALFLILNKNQFKVLRYYIYNMIMYKLCACKCTNVPYSM